MKKKKVSEESKKIGIVMRQIMDEAGDTQTFVANRLGMKQSGFSLYLNGIVEIPLHRFIKFAQMYGIDMGQIASNMVSVRHSPKIDEVYPLIEKLEETLQKTRQRLTPIGFTKILKLMYEDRAKENITDLIEDTLRKAKILDPELFV
ncbi:MAG: helix-turn-helix domain-containing protein [Bacteroidales bacterium]|jgi:transcriptional regulator with XRE-family HTH domain|nr:helix-turn-helix domain-containing protein [Bacteroidales bacterium]